MANNYQLLALAGICIETATIILMGFKIQRIWQKLVAPKEQKGAKSYIMLWDAHLKFISSTLFQSDIQILRTYNPNY